MSNEMLAMAKEALGMFAFLATELTILFIVISYLVGVLQLFITPEKIQSILSSKNGKGYVVAALLGAITPFCSCSTIPFLKGLLRARAGFGPMMVFLFGSPLLNPVIIGLFVITFGWQVALFYFLVAVVVSVVAGYTLEKLGFERYVKPEAYSKESTSSCVKPSCSEPKEVEPSCATTNCGEPKAIEPTKKAQPNRWIKVWHATFKDFKQVFPYLMLGVAIGSFIYGFIPTELIAKYAGDGMWYAIPIAAIIGIPLYIRAEAVIPLSAALVKKGMALGSVMALIIGSAGASLTEVILLKSIFKNQMIAAFLFVIITMAIGAGFLYQAIF
ncbi:permease [Pseudoalteromonas sp. Angola-30]|uniref:permease n=1 Tax=Pseudoalteromonas sp. Angola-30 TaxID=3025341 RepID=UPI002359C169|nr:permease [Pseudoalteromonas sp. Angola-30]MDC9525759.1 permease [Pseudoalteromonas sp. Angola-30]